MTLTTTTTTTVTINKHFSVSARKIKPIQRNLLSCHLITIMKKEPFKVFLWALAAFSFFSRFPVQSLYHTKMNVFVVVS